ATVTLAGSPAGLVVEIIDEGKGFQVEAVRGFGLLGMRERARLAGGELRITSVAGRGTRVWVWLPIRSVMIGQPNGDAMLGATSG
ncbi:MAG: sensor histidine kinase, partial [Planctomycetia bacterium]